MRLHWMTVCSAFPKRGFKVGFAKLDQDIDVEVVGFGDATLMAVATTVM